MSAAYDQAVEFAMRDAKLPRRSSLKQARPRGSKPKKRSVDFSPEVTMSSCSDTSSVQPDDEVFFHPMPVRNNLKSSEQQNNTGNTLDVFSVSVAVPSVPKPSHSHDLSSSAGAYSNPAFDTFGESKVSTGPIAQPFRSPADSYRGYQQQQKQEQLQGTTQFGHVNTTPMSRFDQPHQSVVVLSNGNNLQTHYNQSSRKKPAVCSSKAGCWFAVGGVAVIVAVVVIFIVISQVGFRK